jgi:hypothetical protein
VGRVAEISDRNRAFKQNGSVAESISQDDRIRTGGRDHIGPWREPLRTEEGYGALHGAAGVDGGSRQIVEAKYTPMTNPATCDFKGPSGDLPPR